MEDDNFRPPPPQNPHHLTNHQKIGTRDYVGGPYGCAKIGANPSIGASEQVGEIYRIFFYLYIFSGTHLHVRPVDGFLRLVAQTTRTRAKMCFLGVS